MSTGAQGERQPYEFGEDNRSAGYDRANGGVVTVSSLISRGTVRTPARFHAAFGTAIGTPARFTFYPGPSAADRRNLLPTCPFFAPPAPPRPGRSSFTTRSRDYDRSIAEPPRKVGSSRYLSGSSGTIGDRASERRSTPRKMTGTGIIGPWDDAAAATVPIRRTCVGNN